jgi:putative ABC transport system permease protein
LKRPSFTAVAVMTLALGIGANTAIFSVVMSVLVRPLPYHEPDRLVWLANTNPSLGVAETFLNPEDILDYREQARSLEQIASWGTFPVNLSGGKQPERVENIYVTTNFFQTLGVKPMLGRDFLPDEEEKEDGGVIISYGLWQRQFGGDPDIIGRKIVLGGDSSEPSAVVGVMPADLNFPARVDLFTTYEYEERTGRGGSHNDRTIARLAPGVTIEQAQMEISRIAERQAEQFPDTNRGWYVVVVPFREHLFGSAGVALPLLFGAVGFVLLIACTNVAGLQLARAASRQKEMAVRAALGATRWRIVRGLLAESLLLSVPGGLSGLLLAMWAVEALRVLGPESLPRLKDTTLDPQALLFTVALSVITGILFGIAPALQSSKPNLAEMLKSTGGASPGGSARHRFRSILVISQFALAMVLLVGAGLMIKSFWKLQQTGPGFESEHVLAAGLSLNLSDYHDQTQLQEFYRQALDRLSQLAGVEEAAAISHLPLGGRTLQLNFRIEGREPVSKQNLALADYRVVTPSFFETLRIPLKRGRVFTDRDTAKTPIVFVVNEAFAGAFFSGDDAVGKRMIIGREGQWPGEIIGIVGDVKHRSAEAEAIPAIYACYLQCGPLPTFPIINYVVRTKSDPVAMAEAVRSEILLTHSNQVIYYVRPLPEFVADATAEQRFSMLLLAGFAAIALALAAVGIYGLMSYLVSERKQEIAIRRALGAQTTDVLGLVVGQGIRLSLIGGSVGLASALALTRVMSSMLYGVSATDPATFAVITVILMGVALAACAVPAWPATKVDPGVALRYE